MNFTLPHHKLTPMNEFIQVQKSIDWKEVLKALYKDKGIEMPKDYIYLPKEYIPLSEEQTHTN